MEDHPVSEAVRYIDSESLRVFVGELFAAGGMRLQEAEWYAETIVQANLWGIDSHGIIRVRLISTGSESTRLTVGRRSGLSGKPRR